MIKRYILFLTTASVLLLNISYAGDARLSGMGDLSLLFQDDFHRLDLYDFAKISAGFFRNDSSSSAAFRGSGLKESWGEGSLEYLAIGQAIPQRLMDYAPVEAVAFYEVIPQFKLVPCEIIYVSRRTREVYDSFGNELKPRSYGVYLGYSQLNSEIEDMDVRSSLKTPSLGLIYSKPISDNFDFGLTGDGFYSTVSSSPNDDRISLLPFGGGLGISYNSQSVGLGLNGDYHYSMFKYKGAFADEKFKGHAFSPSFGSLVKLANITWVGALDYKLVSLGGTSNDTIDMGDLKINGFSAKTQLLFAPSFVRVTGFVQHDYKKPIYTDANDDIWFETSYKNYTLGGGTGLALTQVKAGFEGLYAMFAADDEMSNSTVEASALILKCGAELGLVKGFFIRGGYNYNQFDPDQDESNDQSTINTITGGLGLNFWENARVDIAYNYKWTKMDEFPDEQITDHIVFLYLKSTLISKTY